VSGGRIPIDGVTSRLTCNKHSLVICLRYSIVIIGVAKGDVEGPGAPTVLECHANLLGLRVLGFAGCYTHFASKTHKNMPFLWFSAKKTPTPTPFSTSNLKVKLHLCMHCTAKILASSRLWFWCGTCGGSTRCFIRQYLERHWMTSWRCRLNGFLDDSCHGYRRRCRRRFCD